MLYKPFDRLEFNDRTCFLSGGDPVEQITAFPGWILEKYGLAGQPFKLLDESIVTHSDITVPCSPAYLPAILQNEQLVREAFELGYDAVNALSGTVLFQWIGKLVYSILHYEVRMGMRQQARIGEQMTFSRSLIHRFSHFHYMLQSLIRPTIFEGQLPWSIAVFKVSNPPETFSYRDEVNTLTFSLRMNDFGIIACLQDNGSNLHYHQDIVGKSKKPFLHPIQFEEICARFFYSSYLFNRLPEYTLLETPEANYIEPMPLRMAGNKPLFDAWQNKTYGQVLENFWKPWGYLLLEIIKDPEKPMSFLEDDSPSLPENQSSVVISAKASEA